MKPSILCGLFILFNLLSFNSNGQAPANLWSKYWNASQAVQAFEVAANAQGNAILSGVFRTTVDFDPGTGTANTTAVGTFNGYLLKLNGAGEYMWHITFADELTIQVSNVDVNGDILIGGYFRDSIDFDPGSGITMLTSTDLTDAFIAKYTADGNLIWAHSFGSIGFDHVNSITSDANANIFIAGQFDNVVDVDPGSGTAILTGSGSEDSFLSKFDSNGNFVWTKQMGGPSVNSAKSIRVNADGEIFVTSDFYGEVTVDPITNTTISASVLSFFIVKFDADANFLWVRMVSGFNNSNLYNAELDNQSNTYLTGFFTGTADFDPGSNVAELTDTGFAGDLFLLKIDTDGNFVWVKQLGAAAGQDAGYDIIADNQNHIYLSGNFSDTIDFDPSANTFELTSYGQLDGFVSAFTSNGDFLWAVRNGNNQSDFARSMAPTPANELYLAGTQLPSGDSPHHIAYLFKYAATGISVTEFNKNNSTLEIFPNPNNGNFSLQSNEPILSYIVRDINGKVIFQNKKTTFASHISLHDCGSGIYFVEAQTASGIKSGRVVVR